VSLPFDADAVGREFGEEPPPDLVHAGLMEATGAELAAAKSDFLDLPWLTLLGRTGYLVEGWSHLVSGYPRSGKTELLFACALEWLAQAREVLYLTEEPRLIWEARLSPRSGDETLSLLHVVFGLGADVHMLRSRCFNGSEPIVVLDTLRNLLSFHDETDNSAVARVLNPWVTEARRAGKTLIAAHHQRKGGGEHGEGIAGAHALLGTFDIAIELLRDRGDERRRIIRTFARVISPPTFMYERTEGGEMRVLGSPQDVAMDEVIERVRAVLTTEWQKTSELRAVLGDPIPGIEQVRRALAHLTSQGVEREPPLSEGDLPRRTHRWRLPLSTELPPQGR
jgi:hypothetical protein